MGIMIRLLGHRDSQNPEPPKRQPGWEGLRERHGIPVAPVAEIKEVTEVVAEETPAIVVEETPLPTIVVEEPPPIVVEEIAIAPPPEPVAQPLPEALPATTIEETPQTPKPQKKKRSESGPMKMVGSRLPETLSDRLDRHLKASGENKAEFLRRAVEAALPPEVVEGGDVCSA